MALLTDQTQLANPALNDFIHVVDVSDTTGETQPAGTSKKVLLSAIQQLFEADAIVTVNEITDLPAPLTGVITLADRVTYVLGNDVALGTIRIEVGDRSGFVGVNQLSPTLSYTGNGAMFTGRQVSFTMAEINLDCPNGAIFDFEDDISPGTSTATIRTIEIQSCVKVGTFNNLGILLIDTLGAFDADDGILLVGTSWLVQFFTKLIVASTSAGFTGIDFGASISQSIQMFTLFLSGPSGAVGVSGAGGSGNLPSGSVGILSNTNFIGDITPLSGISADDIRWVLTANGQVPNTNPIGMVSLSNNTTETVIGSANTPVKVEGTFVSEFNSLFTADTTGTVTSDVELTLRVSADIVVTVEPASGNNIDITVYAAFDGSVIPASGKSVRVSNNAPRSVTVIWEGDAPPSGSMDIFVENNSNDTNLVVGDAVLRVKA